MKYLKFRYGIILWVMILVAGASCQKVIDLKLNNAAAQMVIEANVIDQYGPQFITLSQSVPFTNKNTFPPVRGASIVVTDSSGKQFNFTETEPGLYSSVPFRGIYGHTYTMTVKSGGLTYTAQSTMPFPVSLDSVTAKIDAFDNKNRRTIQVNYQDPQDVANYYRFVLYVNQQEVDDVFVNDDSFSNGRYVQLELFEASNDVLAGDTATVEMQCIDKNVYKYWFSLSQQQANGPGGAVTPSNPPSNINNNALGYFSAHTTQTKSIIVY